MDLLGTCRAIIAIAIMHCATVCQSRLYRICLDVFLIMISI